HLAEALGMEDLIPRSACQSFYEKGGGLCLDGVYLLRAPACTFDEVEAAVLRPEAMGVDKRHKAAPDIEYSDHWPVRVKITFECAVEEKNTESAARETAWQSDSFFLALPEGLKILVTQASQLLYGVLAGIWGHSSVG
ncbi:MAG: hypothetical protein HY042_12535, partial [Spirochaetia bacterium]|nr:hypothetical protein [Spirochaetia bacterium]